MKPSGNPQLFTPGPVSVSPRVLAAGSRPMIHHRTPEFHALLENVIEKMKRLFGTRPHPRKSLTSRIPTTLTI